MTQWTRASTSTAALMRIGLIGCGGIGQVRAAALRETRGLRLAVASDVDRDRATAVAGPVGAAVERDWRALLGRDDVDAVVISTPPSLHAEMAVEALRAGKHVLCEKPLARGVEESRAMVDAAAQANRFLATGFNYRFYPSMQKARELLDSGAIGALDHVRAYTGYSAADHNPPWVHDADVVGGGSLRDNGIHLLDLTRWFLGEVVEVKGLATRSVWDFPGCEDNGFALLRSASGAVATLQASWTEWRRYAFRLELYGTRGCIRATCFPMLTDLVQFDQLGGPVRRRHFLFPKANLMEKVRSYRWNVLQSFVQEFEAFAAATRGAETPVGTGLDGLRAIEIAVAAVADGEPPSLLGRASPHGRTLVGAARA